MTTSQLRLHDILALPALSRAHAELLAGADRPETPIRWVHVVDTVRAGALFDGGELLLTTGIIFDGNPAHQRALIDRFHSGGAAALLIEVGVQIKQLPPEVVLQCRIRNLPLIVVYEEICFIEITEVVHHAIVQRQFEQVAELQRINESFWGLMYNGAPPEQLLRHTSRELGHPVVLEDLHHRVVLYSEGHLLPSKLLHNWEPKSRAWAQEIASIGLVADPVNVRDPDDQRPWSLIDIQARGCHWGRLYARDADATDPQSSHVLRHAAMALSIERLGNPNPHSWTDLRERIGLERLLGNRFVTAEGQRTVLESSGLSTHERSLVTAELRLAPTPGARTVPPTELRRALGQLSPTLGTLIAPHPNHPRRFVCVLSDQPLRYTPQALAEAAFAQLAEALPHTPFEFAVSIGLEGPVDIASALHLISEAPLADPSSGPVLSWVSRDRIEGIIGTLHQDVRAQAFAESLLAPLLLHDEQTGSDLIGTLAVLLHHPTSRSAAAEKLHLSRAAFYTRFATIECLLDTDLADGDQLFRLALVLHTYRGT